MQLRRILLSLALCAITVAACARGSGRTVTTRQEPATPPSGAPFAPPAPLIRTDKGLRTPDVVYVPTPPEVVLAMLKVANVGKGDVLYDLGSGDGRIVIVAARDFGIARGVGIDIDPQRIEEANANAREAGVTDRVRFLNQDLFESDFSDATVVTLYLLPELNYRLRPKLLSTLKPGTRIVSHAFDMGEWEPESTLTIEGRKVYFWTIPERGKTP